MTEAYTTEITLTVPAGRFCMTTRRQCRFLIDMYNYPGYCCFLIPESRWERWQPIRKHPKCPSLNQIRKPIKGEGIAVMERLHNFKKLMEERGE